MADKIMLIRHGEKPNDPKPAPGYDLSGNKDPKSLTKAGWKRAHKLVEFFHPRLAAPPKGIAVPNALYAARPEKDGSKRHVETIVPLAQSFTPPLRIDAGIEAEDEANLAAALRAVNGIVLVSWKHENILGISRRLSPHGALPHKWPHRRFDLVFVFDRQGANYAFSQVAQRLMPDDDRDVLPLDESD